MRTVVTGEAVELELPPASVFSRGASVIVDLITYAVLCTGILVLFGVASAAPFMVLDPAMTMALTLSTVILCFVILPATVETLSRGRSLGRLIMGLRIVRDDGGTVRFRHAFIRALVGVGEFAFTMGLAPVICAMVSRRGKRVGDLVAGTYGILIRQPAVRPMMLPVPQHLQSWTQIADVGRIPDGLAVRVARLLRGLEAHRETAASPLVQRTATHLVNELQAYVSPPPPPCSPMEFLTAVLAERRNREYRRMRRQQQRQTALGERLHRLPYSART